MHDLFSLGGQTARFAGGLYASGRPMAAIVLAFGRPGSVFARNAATVRPRARVATQR